MWEVEEGIGEHRAIRRGANGAITAARLDWPDASAKALAAGLIADAVLIARAAGSPRGTLRFPGGGEALIDGLPANASEGAAVRAEVARPAMAETGRLKRARARLATAPPRPAPTLAERLRGDYERVEGERVRVRVVRDLGGDWDELFAEAWDPVIDFARGSLIVSPTPGMTVIDIDGTLAPRALALAAVPAIAQAIGRMDLAGSIGIDFPTIADKAERRLVDTALASALADWRHERTAMNGFGFVQLIARVERLSLPQRIAADRAGAAARALLRRAERVEGPGTLLLVAHPAVLHAVRADWRAALIRNTGRTVDWREDTALALAGGYAQVLR